MGPADGEWILDEAARSAGANEHQAGVHEPGADPVAEAEAWLNGDEGQPGEEWRAGERRRPEGGWPEGGWPEGGWPEAGWPEGGWPEGGWPERDELGDEWPEAGWAPGPGGPRPEAGRRWGHGGFPGFSVWAVAAVAVLAAAAGVAAGLLLVKAAPSASVSGAATPGATAPGSAGTAGHGNGQLRIILTGRLLAVSATSITIGGDGPPVTAAVTGATKITGTARGIADVKVGDEVAAQVSGTPGHLTATAIQDPAH